MILTIAIRELKNLFLSPLAWAILAVLQLVIAFLFLSQLDTYMSTWQPRLAGIEGAPGVTDLVVAPLFQTVGFLLLLISPAITMRSISEEQRNRTLTLLLSAPVSIREIVLGKFLGITLFFFILLLMLMAMPLSLYSGTTLDAGKLLSGLLGLALLSSAFAAIGLFLSSLTEQPVVAAISTLGLLMLLWIIDWNSSASENISGLFQYLSLKTHFNAFLKGIFSTRDLVYYLLLISVFLILGIRRLDQKRLTG
ncbi:ABC-2 type transport system permease protein [Thiogranum longum]|uniref:ABC-2 type transport system permease protein n=1 Tax=Thiogranum longum TaxID=1537524 RepID=A0A4R1H7D3_9GAMM|nr:ABC transporter permease subunit [Thiogranum longum]TCK17108.1 ABC-2 type transport system permease protein [Thiogranum longum]